MSEDWGSHVHRIDPRSNRFVGEPATVGVEAVGIAFGADSVWTANHDDSTVSRIDPKTNTVIASHDVVAADAYAATLFDLTGAEVKHVQKAAEMGLGTLDLKSIKVEEVNA